ncbi:class A beta-lactamase [Polymorphobacter fuscus]|uniref:Beta-lactamase n=1 Tax=Sandarakinorhabdus fusca TaxID=1439888 RepID=A0A7C9KV67_9SPHN|nr:class A beta-lactamase [Polymorphobacter fuscus]KAB7648497.1 class A beta-lactamase [Polymorphobacter fuscus]MQT16025.1 class A beta-lactamase [Polymorphobacter fuscus]NJC07698.1 beta-lactamase class A [Polymorphobacter fuscus]
MIDRRSFTGLVLLAATPALARTPAGFDLAAAVKTAEAASGGRVGLAVHDTATGRRFSHRGGERFAMASTFKTLLAAAVLARIDAGEDRLDRAIPVAQGDILGNSPFAERRIGRTASVAELAEAAIIYSDNAAANLLLPSVGGPAGLTAWLRRTGDPVTRLDRNEPTLNEARPGDPRDTSSPDAIAATWQRLLVGPVLTPASRALLTGWLVGNTTGDTRLRAGLPKGWRVGDKTGTGRNGSVNDIAIAWPDRTAPGPVIIASFINEGTAAAEVLYALHADLARAVVAAIGH